jgi:hypothetical protein
MRWEWPRVSAAFSNQPEINHHMPFLPFLGVTFAALGLVKLGAQRHGSSLV